jgi:hypothetical protein
MVIHAESRGLEESCRTNPASADKAGKSMQWTEQKQALRHDFYYYIDLSPMAG